MGAASILFGAFCIHQLYLVICGLHLFLSQGVQAPPIYTLKEQTDWVKRTIDHRPYERTPAIPQPPHNNRTDLPLIPRTIQMLWKTSNTSDYPLLTASESAWRQVYEPLGWTVRVWSDGELNDLIRTKYHWLWPLYKKYPRQIQRADIGRLVLLYEQGGVYVDLDAFPANNASLNNIYLLSANLVFPRSHEGMAITNHFMMARPKSPFLRYALENAHRFAHYNRLWISPYLSVFASTGPLYLHSILNEYTQYYRQRIISSEDKIRTGAISIPVPVVIPERICVLNPHQGRIFIKHYTGRSWIGWDGRIINAIGDYLSFLFKYEQPEQSTASFAYISMIHHWSSTLVLVLIFVVVYKKRGRLRYKKKACCTCCTGCCNMWSQSCGEFSCNHTTYTFATATPATISYSGGATNDNDNSGRRGTCNSASAEWDKTKESV